MKVPFEQLEVGDFFRVDLQEISSSLLYQKITERCGYNVVLLNTGEIGCIYIDKNKLYEKVEVHFEIRPL